MMRRLAMVGAVLGSLGLSTAHAAEGLVWAWPADEVRKYRVKTSLKLPLAIIFKAEENVEARVFDVDMAVDANCKPDGPTSSLLVVRCDITAAQLVAAADPQDQNRLQRILDEWDQKLVDDATVELTFSDDGRVKKVDLQGLNERIQRIRFIKETMHLIVTRAFSSFDLELPKKGVDEGQPWKQRSPLVAQLPVITGMAGSSQIENQVVAQDGSVVTIDSVGRAVLVVQPLVELGTVQPDTYDMSVRSRATFDVERGMLLTRSTIAEGQMTPSSGNAVGRQAAPYIQGSELIYIAPGSSIENLGPNKDNTPAPGKSAEPAP